TKVPATHAKAEGTGKERATLRRKAGRGISPAHCAASLPTHSWPQWLPSRALCSLCSLCCCDHVQVLNSGLTGRQAHAQAGATARECWPMPCHVGIIRGADQGLAAFSPPCTLLPHTAPVHTSVGQCRGPAISSLMRGREKAGCEARPCESTFRKELPFGLFLP